MVDDDGWVGREIQVTYVVAESDLAIALGSGDVPVLATPRVLAWFEAATVSVLGDLLAPERTSVGIAVEVDHVAASPVGADVIVSATIRRSDSRSVTFDCQAAHLVGSGGATVIAEGTVTRAIVDRQRFLAKLPAAAGTDSGGTG